MRRPAYQQLDQGRGDVKMTPMIDVVFLLLVFFVCTASFQVPEEILPTNVLSAPGDSVPPPDRTPPPPVEEIVIKMQVGQAGQLVWLIENQPYASLDEVDRVLRPLAEIGPDLPVILDIEGAVPMGDVIRLYDRCRLAGFLAVHFAAEEA
jgi:biopolymer transport protein ExbD